jgi:hypothetical protein
MSVGAPALDRCLARFFRDMWRFDLVTRRWTVVRQSGDARRGRGWLAATSSLPCNGGGPELRSVAPHILFEGEAWYVRLSAPLLSQRVPPRLPGSYGGGSVFAVPVSTALALECGDRWVISTRVRASGTSLCRRPRPCAERRYFVDILGGAAAWTDAVPPTTVHRFDMRSHQWACKPPQVSPDANGAGAPVWINYDALVSPAFWAADGVLYIFGPNNPILGADDASAIWALSGMAAASASSSATRENAKGTRALCAASTAPVTGPGGRGPPLKWTRISACNRGSAGLSGLPLVPVSEATACYDPTSRRAFVYGGWNEQFNTWGVSRDKTVRRGGCACVGRITAIRITQRVHNCCRCVNVVARACAVLNRCTCNNARVVIGVFSTTIMDWRKECQWKRALSTVFVRLRVACIV